MEDDDKGSEARRFSISVVDIPVSKKEVLSTTWEKNMKEKTLGIKHMRSSELIL